MNDKSRILVLPLILVVLLVAIVSSPSINIIPNNFTGVCSDYRNETCLTLAELASNTSRLDQPNIILNFIPGDHVLAQRITVNDVTSLVLTGRVCNTSQFETKLKCQGTSGFEFKNVETLNITNLEFSGCGGDKINGGALQVRNVTFMLIFNSYFIGNGVFGVRVLGGAVYIETAFDVSIVSNYFINNSVQCNYDVHQSQCDPALNKGGAIFMSDIRKVSLILSCHFEHNSAYTHGGAVASTRSTLVVVHSMFVYNQVHNYTTGLGGAVHVIEGDMSTSNSHYIKNGAVYGGAIYFNLSGFVSSADTYTYNYAYLSGGAVCGNLSSISSNNNTYSRNSAHHGGAIFMVYSNISDVGSYYAMNRVTRFGGAIYTINTTVSNSKSCFISNRATISGGSIYVDNGNLSISGGKHSENQAEYGAVIYIHNGFVNTTSCMFFNNKEILDGGVMYAETSSTINSMDSYYINNSALYGGVFKVHHSCLLTSQSYYTNNTAKEFGGSIFVDTGSVSISGGDFSNNQAEAGAVFFVQNSSVYTTSCLYLNNRAKLDGGVMFFDSSSIVNSLDSNYTSNSALHGGAFAIFQGSLQTSQSYFTNNTAIIGGAIFCTCLDLSNACSIVSTGNYYMQNCANDSGGAISVVDSCNIHDTDDYFSYNYAEVGGAMYNQQGTISISKTVFSNNNAISAGGAIFTRHSVLSISEIHFTKNTANGGGALYCATTSLTMMYCNYTCNQAHEGGAILISDGLSTSCTNGYYVNNIAFSIGGAISVPSGNFACTGCYFKENQAMYQAGAILIGYGNVSCVNSSYSNNVAGNLAYGGAIYVHKGFVSTSRSNYTGNVGGAIYINDEGSAFSSKSCYVNNTSYKGGAIFVNKGIVISNSSQFFNNTADYGGAIYIQRGNVICVNSSFKQNRAHYCGAISARNSDSVVSSFGCVYESNIVSVYGGAICSYHGAVSSSNTNYTDNNSDDLGGAMFVFGGNISITDSTFVNNKAHRAGGAICALLSNIYSERSYYGDNHVDEHGGAIYTDSCTLTSSRFLVQPGTDDKPLLASAKSICAENEYLDRPEFGSVKIELSLDNTFINNTCGFVGGAIIGIQVGIIVNGIVPTVVCNNAATYGGGIALAWSTMNIHSPVEIQDNKAKWSGGGIFSYQSNIIFTSQSAKNYIINIRGNAVSQNGGGVYAIGSYIKITRGRMDFENNVARKGAAIYLERNSNIRLLKERRETEGEYDRKLTFIDNHAQYGGAVYVSDSTKGILACERGVPGSNLSQSSQECFIQTLLLHTTASVTDTKANHFNVLFLNNTANVSGGAIYGGLLDRCMLNSSAELVAQFPEYRQSTGFDYIRVTAKFAGLVDYDNLTLNYIPDKLIDAIKSPSVEGLISSEPVQVCFCLENVHNCSHEHRNVFTKKGQLFRLSVVAVDQVGNPINATVTSSFVSNNVELNIDQARQKTTTNCTELEYNVYPKGDSKSSQIELYAEGPCKDHGISERILNVTFLPCTCPIGFQPVETETQCTCDCDPILRPKYISNCSYTVETVLRDSNAWIDYVNTTTDSEAGYLIYPNCPFDYCVNKPVSVNLNILNGADVQCAFNRSGKLCGACKKSFSLVMGSSHCQQCPNSLISLIIPFAVGGIILVAFILIFNTTVATATTHGLIFYANILVASRSIFIPFDTPKIFIVFVSWINLDLGIETCFYNGMDSYAKVLLQLAFPAYIILITIMIIIISEYSIRFSTLIGKKDPVATLCTLILLTYCKLIRTIIASLQFTYLNYPDGSSEIVWLYDANVPYFSPSHIFIIVTAIAIIILGSVYTIMIFFGQWIPRCGNRRFLTWVNNPKYNAFIDKYQAPFNPKHRYWVGLLLFARIFHYLLSAFVSDSATLLSVGCIVLGLLLLKLWNFNTLSIYKDQLLDTLETSFFINLGIVTYATYHVQGSEGNQIALASTSLGISFVIVLGIVIYHFYAYILKETRFCNTILESLQRIVQICNRCKKYERIEDDRGDDEQDEEIIEMQPLYTDNNDTCRDSVHLPLHYDPPVIIPAVRYDQPREPDLDILDPITDDHYRQVNQPPAPRPRQAPTCTEIDFVRPCSDGDRLHHP